MMSHLCRHLHYGAVRRGGGQTKRIREERRDGREGHNYLLHVTKTRDVALSMNRRGRRKQISLNRKERGAFIEVCLLLKPILNFYNNYFFLFALHS